MLLALLGTAKATTFLTLQSSCLGNGWFQYQLNVMADPFFKAVNIGGLYFNNFTNPIEHMANADGWSYSDYGNRWVNWSSANGYAARPYSATFLMRSTESSCRMGSLYSEGATVIMSLSLNEVNPGYNIYEQDIVGYANLPCLIPCRPDEADGSPTSFVYTMKLVPDVILNQLIQTNGLTYGMDYTWNINTSDNYDATFVLEGSTDLQTWTNITYIHASTPETIWTTNSPLNDYGQFFRLELFSFESRYGYGAAPSVASPKQSSPAGATKSIAPATPQVTGCQLVKGELVVNVATQPGQTILVQAVDAHGNIQQTKQVSALNVSATATFAPAGLPNPVYFRALAAP